MNKCLLILLCFGMVGQAFAMKRTYEDEVPIEENAIYQKYPDVKVAYEKMTSTDADNFFNLSLEELGDLLKNPWFATDKENSVLFLVIEYLKNYQKYKGYSVDENQLHNLFSEIHWHDVTLQYLQTVLELSDPSLSLLNESCTQEYMRRTNKQPADSGKSRKKFEDYNSISMEIVGENVNTWDPDQNYYSPPIFAHGYMISYFFKRQPNDKKFGLAWYLNVQGPGDNLYNVPIRYSVVIDRREGEKLFFKPVEAVLETSEKSIGIMLTTGKETWVDVKIGRSIMVDKNAIKATLRIDFTGSLLYKNIRQVYAALEGEKLFSHGVENFITLIESSAFGTDNENSILFLVFKYLKYCQDNKLSINSRQLVRLLNAISWHDVSKNYLAFFANLSDGILLTPLRDRCCAQTKNNQPNRRLKSRSKITQSSDLIFIKCVFENVNAWKEDGKYYSSPVLINGYEFYYFLQRQRIGNTEPPQYGLAGFLRLNRPVENHYEIPVEYDVVVKLQGGEDRRFNPMRVKFLSSERAIGGPLTIYGETWEDIIKKPSKLVYNNAITVIVSIQMPDVGDGFLSLDNN